MVFIRSYLLTLECKVDVNRRHFLLMIINYGAQCEDNLK